MTSYTLRPSLAKLDHRDLVVCYCTESIGSLIYFIEDVSQWGQIISFSIHGILYNLLSLGIRGKYLSTLLGSCDSFVPGFLGFNLYLGVLHQKYFVVFLCSFQYRIQLFSHTSIHLAFIPRSVSISFMIGYFIGKVFPFCNHHFKMGKRAMRLALDQPYYFSKLCSSTITERVISLPSHEGYSFSLTFFI